MTKVIAVVGPTASGKSALAVDLARKFGGEVISADSRQVYKGMDIGTGKITAREMHGVPHHLLSFASPKGRSISAAAFQVLAAKKIGEIAQRGHLPIITGGSGFWVDALLSGQIFPEAPANPKLRSRLGRKGAEELFQLLRKLDANRAKNIDRHNKVRLIRAIEIAKYFGKNKKKGTGQTTVAEKTTVKQYQSLYIGLDMPTAKLYKKIEQRLKQRIARGLIAEVSKLHRSGVSWKKLESFGLEYRFVAAYLQGKIKNAAGRADKNKMRELLFFAIKHYAKRQRTWFRRNKNTHWLDASGKNLLTRSSKLVLQFLF